MFNKKRIDELEKRIEGLEVDSMRLFGRVNALENPPFEPRIFDFPEKHVDKLLDLYDKKVEGGKRTDHVRLWKFIGEVLPVTKEGEWKIVLGGKVRIEEVA